MPCLEAWQVCGWGSFRDALLAVGSMAKLIATPHTQRPSCRPTEVSS
jgi:hypothetical protein